MYRFIDAAGRGWEFGLTLGDARRVHQRTGISLRAPEDLRRMAGPERDFLVAAIVGTLCEPQARKLWPEDAPYPDRLQARWDELLDEPGILDAAFEQLAEAVADFFRAKGLQKLAQEIQAMPRRLRTALTAGEAETETPGGSPTTTPES
jgi:1,6-anhydro-N-acetylmuramate kinase